MKFITFKIFFKSENQMIKCTKLRQFWKKCWLGRIKVVPKLEASSQTKDQVKSNLLVTNIGTLVENCRAYSTSL